MSKQEITCQGCGAVAPETLSERRKFGWDWHTGFREYTAYWCPKCQQYCTSAYHLDIKHAFSAPTVGQANGTGNTP